MSQTIQIKGMHCSACEKLISKRISKIDGVNEVHVRVNEGLAEIDANRTIDPSEVTTVLQGLDYTVINSN